MPSATEFAVTDGVTIAFLAHPWGIYGAKKLSSWCRAWNERGRIFETAMFDAPAYMLLLRDYGSRRGEYRQLLSIERFPFGQPNDREVLTLNSSPIFFTNLRTAKAIAKLCHPQPRQEAQALHWMRITGEDHSVQ